MSDIPTNGTFVDSVDESDDNWDYQYPNIPVNQGTKAPEPTYTLSEAEEILLPRIVARIMKHPELRIFIPDGDSPLMGCWNAISTEEVITKLEEGDGD